MESSQNERLFAAGKRRRWPRALVMLTIAGAGVSLVSVTGILGEDLPVSRQVHLLGLNVLGGWCYVFAGIIARRRAVSSVTGTRMIAVGLAWLVSALKWVLDVPLLITIGGLFEWLWAALLVHLTLSFPHGRLAARPARLTVAAAYTVALPGRATWMIVANQHQFFAGEPIRQPTGCASCPRSIVSSGVAPHVAATIGTAEQVAVAVVGVTVAIQLIFRWRYGSKPQRRALGPVLAVMAAAVALTVASTAARVAGAPEVAGVLTWLFDGASLLVPFAFLAGILWTRLRVGAGLASVFEQLSSVDSGQGIDAGLRKALGDDSLIVAYWLPDERRFVTADGVPVSLPEPGSGADVTDVELHGNHVATLIHDSSLSGDIDYVRASGRAAVLWLERARLEAERNARLVELRESRTRLVEAADAERRRIERDLHDGAQQRLAGMLLATKLRRRGARPTDADELLDEIERGLAATLGELRALAAGILPPVLTDYGLPAALEELASRTPIPVAVHASGVGRMPERVEAAGYFVGAEALANVIKHADARTVVARVACENGMVVIEVADDGVGGATPASGSGLRGLADRVTALDGRLECSSPPGGGTVLRAEIPCES